MQCDARKGRAVILGVDLARTIARGFSRLYLGSDDHLPFFSVKSRTSVRFLRSDEFGMTLSPFACRVHVAPEADPKLIWNWDVTVTEL